MTTVNKNPDVALAGRVWLSANRHLHRAVEARPPAERDALRTALNVAMHLVHRTVQRVEAAPEAPQSALPLENQEVSK
jgi:hypothetical protein